VITHGFSIIEHYKSALFGKEQGAFQLERKLRLDLTANKPLHPAAKI